MNNDFLKPGQVADILQCSVATVDKLDRTGTLPFVRVGGLRRLAREDLERTLRTLRDGRRVAA